MRPPHLPPPPTSLRREIQPGIWLDSRLALWLETERLLVVADLHWGYAASHRARGNLLPLWGDDDLESRLRALLANYAPCEMLWLGDVVHAPEGGARAERFLRDAPVPITLIAGNHDRRWRVALRSLVRGSCFFHHGDLALEAPPGLLEITGHHHPAVTWGDQAGSRFKFPALVASPSRLVLPAFSPWAAGMPWNDRLAPTDTLWVIAPTRIFPLPPAASSCGRNRP